MAADHIHVQSVDIDDIPRPMADVMFKDIYDRERAHAQHIDERREEIVNAVANEVMPSVLYEDDDGIPILDYEALGRWYIGTALRFLTECDSDLPKEVANQVACGDCDVPMNLVVAGISYGFCSMSLGHDEICEMNDNIADMNEALETCADVIRSTGQNDRSPLVVMKDLRELREMFEDDE